MPIPIADGIYQDRMFNRRITFPVGQKGICQCFITALIQTSWISISFETEGNNPALRLQTGLCFLHHYTWIFVSFAIRYCKNKINRRK